MNEEQMLRISREIDAVISGDVKPPSKKKNLPAFVTHLGLAGLTFAGLSFGSGLAKASESQTRPVPTETPTPGLTPTVTPTPEIAVSTELSATSPIEFDFVSNVETDAQEFIKPDITQTIASPAFRKQPGTSSEYVDEQKQRFTPGTYLEVLDIPDEKLTKEQREQKEKTGIAPRETETKDGWIWEYVKTVSNVNGSSSPEGTGYVAREKVDGTSDLTAHISYNTLPDSVKNQLESEEERYKKLEVPGQDEGLGYNLTSLPEQYVGIGGNEGVITKALELWDIPSSEQEEFIKQSEAFIKASAEDPSFAFKRYLAGVLEALKKEELIPGLTLIASTETGFTEEKFGMYAVRTENGIILLTSRLGDKHILATSLNQTVGTDGITSFNVGRFSALFPANIQSLIEQTITETDKPDEARLRFDTIYRSLPVASQTAQLDSGKLTLDPTTEPESVQLLTGLSLGIYLEKLATIAPQAPSEEGDTVTYTYNEDKGVYEAEVTSTTASPDSDNQKTTTNFIYVSEVGEWRVQENNHYDVEGENYKWFGGFDVDIRFPDGSRIVMTEGAPERLAEQVLAALAHQRGLSQEALQEELNRTNGKMEVIIPKGDPEFIGNETSLAIFTRTEVDFSRGIKIVTQELPPEEDSQIKPGVNHKDKDGNLLPLWYFFSIENGQLVISISKSNVHLIPNGKHVMEDPENLRPSAVGFSVSAFLFAPFSYLAYANEYEEVQRMLLGEEIREVTISRPNVPSGEQFREFYFFKADSTARQKKGTPTYEDTDVLNLGSFYEYDQNNAENPYVFTLFMQGK